MGRLLRGVTRRNVIAIVVGVLLAGAPLVAFEFWLGGLVDRQGRDEVNASAQRAVALADARVANVIHAIDALAAQGVASCRPEHIEAMRRAAFATMPVKEFAILGPDGQTLCTHLGLPLEQRAIRSSEPLAGPQGYILDVVALANGRPMVRLRRQSGPHGIAALVPASLFLPQLEMQAEQLGAHARIVTPAGSTIVEAAARAPQATNDIFAAKASSTAYGFRAEISTPRAQMAASQSDIKWIGIIASGAIVVIVALCALLMPRRSSVNPVAELERALAAGEFVPYYQPIVDIRSGQLRGAEVLVRWKKPDGTLVLPGAFIPLAESSGLIREMTRDLMRCVCAEAGDAIGCRPALKISFNFAGKLFCDDSIVKDVRKIFAASPIKLSQVVLEVTERDPIENFTETRQIIAALQGLGVRIAIDDVGTGHSGLSYMLKLGVDIIKIDKMFVDAIGTDRNSTTIVETLIDLAHNMRMDVVAEGVENFEQVMHLRELGVRSAQGYVFAPPLPGSAFLKLVEAIDPVPTAQTTTPVLALAGRADAA
jgi:sensor c-di-GMP phosphodiesterase-like protein